MSDEAAGGIPTQTPEPHLDPERLQLLLERLRTEQNLPAGVLAGFFAAVAGAVGWAIVTVVTKWQIGWMAVGVGYLVGFAVKKFGRGVDRSFGVAGAILSLIGCAVGNLLSACALLASQDSVPFKDVLASLNPRLAVDLMTATFSPMDLLFYGIAVYEGFRLSIRPVKAEDLKNL